MYDLCQTLKNAFETKVLLRENRSNMKKNIGIQKWCGKDENFLSFIPNRGCSNFVLREAETTLSPSRQGRVVPLRMRLGKELVTNK